MKKMITILVFALSFQALSTAGEKEDILYEFSTLAGSENGYLDGPGVMARFNAPEGIAVDRLGNIYVTEYWNNIVRKVSADGQVTTLAGKMNEFGSEDGPGEEARFDRPHGLCVSEDLNVYVCDMKNSTIRRIDPAGVVTTLAGIPASRGNQDGPVELATFNQPEDIAVNSKGYLYVADTYNFTIREISPDGVVRTFAGAAGEAGYADGHGSEARFNMTIGIAIDGSDNLYVADSNYDGELNGNCLIRKITPDGFVSTIAGTQGIAGHVDAHGLNAQFDRPVGIAAAADGTLFIADTEADLIRRIDTEGNVSTIGGSYLQEDFADGAGPDARFNDPQAIAVDRRGRIYIADTFTHRIRLGVRKSSCLE